MTADGGDSRNSPQHPQDALTPQTSVEASLDHHREELLAALAKLGRDGRLSKEVSRRPQIAGDADV